MNVSASTVRKSSRIVSLAFTLGTVGYALSISDTSGGLWAATKSCIATMFTLLPVWATLLYSAVAILALIGSLVQGGLAWGVTVHPSRPGKVTLWAILLWAMLLPSETIMLLVSWPFILGRLTLLRTNPD